MDIDLGDWSGKWGLDGPQQDEINWSTDSKTNSKAW